MLSTKGQLDCYFQYSTLCHKTISCTQYVFSGTFCFSWVIILHGSVAQLLSIFRASAIKQRSTFSFTEAIFLIFMSTIAINLTHFCELMS